MKPPLMRRAPDPKKKADAKFGSGDGDSTDDFSGKAKLKAAKSLMVDLDVEGRLNGFHWAGVHTTAKAEDLCPEGMGPDRDGYSLVLSNCFGGKMFDTFRTELNKYSYDRVSGLLYYMVGLTAPEGGLKQSERVPEPRLMGTSADDVRKHKQDLDRYFEHLTLLNPVRQGAENMLAHHEAVLRQCTNPSMTAKLQDLVSDIREIFRGDSKKTKGPEAFNLMKSELEVLERQLRDEEATQRQKAVKFNFTAETGAGDPSMAAAARSSEKWPLAPCFFAATRYCLKMKLVDDAGRPVTKCPMQEKGLCDRPHDDASCKKEYADNEYFKERVDSYGEIAKANGNKVPTKEQLQDAGVLPPARKSGGKGAKGRGGGDGRGRGSGKGRGRGGHQVNTAGAIVVFAGSQHGHQVAVLDRRDVLMSGGSYASDAGDVTPKVGKAADATDSEIEMKGTFAENKDGVVACQGQAATLMAKYQPASARVQSANRFAPLSKGSSGRYGPCVTSPGGAAVVAAPGNAVKAGSENKQQQVQKERSVQQPAANPTTLSATHFNIPPVPSSFGPISSYNASAVPTLDAGSIKTAEADPKSSVESGANEKGAQCHSLTMGPKATVAVRPREKRGTAVI